MRVQPSVNCCGEPATGGYRFRSRTLSITIGAYGIGRVKPALRGSLVRPWLRRAADPVAGAITIPSLRLGTCAHDGIERQVVPGVESRIERGGGGLAIGRIEPRDRRGKVAELVTGEP